MKRVGIEQATLDACVREAQNGRVLVTRGGLPVALVVGIEGLDEEQIGLGSSEQFWKLISERRNQRSISRTDLEERAGKATDPQ